VRAKTTLLLYLSPRIILRYHASHGEMQICTLLIAASDAGWWRCPRRRIQFGTPGKRDISPVWCHCFVNPDKTTPRYCRRAAACAETPFSFLHIIFSPPLSPSYTTSARSRIRNQANWSIRSAREINNFAFCVHGVMQRRTFFLCVGAFFFIFLFLHVVHHARDLFFFLPL